MNLVLTFWKYGFLSIYAYRKSFLMQAGFMMLNNGFILALFVLFFQKFGTIGGMTFEQYVPFYAFQLMLFGIVHGLFMGYDDISLSIREWKLDNQIITPKSPLLKIITGRMSFSAIGDFVSGVLFLGYFSPYLLVDIGFLCRLSLGLMVGSIAWIGVMVAYHSLGFFIGSSEKIAEGAFNSMLGSTLYPPAIYEGTFMKTVLLTIFPAYFVGFYPYFFAISNWNLVLLGYSCLGAVIFVTIGICVFQRGIRRYESGNLMVTNV